jgi:hypothetical protein
MLTKHPKHLGHKFYNYGNVPQNLKGYLCQSV